MFGAKPSAHMSTPLTKPASWQLMAVQGVTVLIVSVQATYFFEAARMAAKLLGCSVQDIKVYQSPFTQATDAALRKKCGL